MDLEALLTNTRSKFICFLDSEGKILDSCSQENIQLEKEKTLAFSTILFNMTNHFFTDFLKSELFHINIKSDKENIILVKHNNHVLCLLSDENINMGLLSISLKKKTNK